MNKVEKTKAFIEKLLEDMLIIIDNVPTCNEAAKETFLGECDNAFDEAIGAEKMANAILDYMEGLDDH